MGSSLEKDAPSRTIPHGDTVVMPSKRRIPGTVAAHFPLDGRGRQGEEIRERRTGGGKNPRKGREPVDFPAWAVVGLRDL